LRASPFLSWNGVMLWSLLALSTVPPVFGRPRVSRGLEAYFYFSSEGCMFNLL
jgi:hypothetical protein